MPLPRSRTLTALTALTLRTARTARTALVAAATLAAPGCGDDSTEPTGLTGTYGLTSAGGAVLPYVFFSGLACDRRIVGGKVEFRSGTQLLDIRDYQRVCGTTADPVDTDTLVAPYRLEGARVIVSRTAAGGAQTYSDTGAVDGNFFTLTVRDVQELRNLNVSMVYEKP